MNWPFNQTVSQTSVCVSVLLLCLKRGIKLDDSGLVGVCKCRVSTCFSLCMLQYLFSERVHCLSAYNRVSVSPYFSHWSISHTLTVSSCSLFTFLFFCVPAAVLYVKSSLYTCTRGCSGSDPSLSLLQDISREDTV